MKYPLLFSLASLQSPTSSASGETVVKVLHPIATAEVLEIWQSIAAEYEQAHPGVKVQFDYLENEEFKAKLPSLLQSNDPLDLRGNGSTSRSQDGRVFNNEAAAVAVGAKSPDDAVKAIEYSWPENRI